MNDSIQSQVVHARGVTKPPRRAKARFADPWAKLGPLRDRLSSAAVPTVKTPPNPRVPERPAPSSRVISEDLPGAWLREMLFNSGAIEAAWSELDALREAEAEEPLPSPHPRRLREYGRCRRGS